MKNLTEISSADMVIVHNSNQSYISLSQCTDICDLWFLDKFVTQSSGERVFFINKSWKKEQEIVSRFPNNINDFM